MINCIHQKFVGNVQRMAGGDVAGTVACETCRNTRRPCLAYDPNREVLVLLPLSRGDREGVEEGEMGYYVRPVKKL